MNRFRKISLTAVLFAFTLLIAHIVVPYHHSSGASVVCISSTHTQSETCCYSHSYSTHNRTDDNKVDIWEHETDHCNDFLCGLSHTFTHCSTQESNLTPFYVDCQSIIPESICVETDTYILSPDMEITHEYIVRGIPLRAPPAVV